MKRISFALVLSVFSALLLAGGACASASEKTTTGKEPVASGYVFIPSEFAEQLDDIDPDSLFASLLNRLACSNEQGGFFFQPYRGCSSLNCHNPAHIHFTQEIQ